MGDLVKINEKLKNSVTSKGASNVQAAEAKKNAAGGAGETSKATKRGSEWRGDKSGTQNPADTTTVKAETEVKE